MKITNTIKYKALKKPLVLKKRHDFCASKHPRLTVIMLHGIASSAGTYEHALIHLEKNPALADIRFITLDWLGHGKSYASKKLEYTISEQTKALNTTIKALRIDTPIILMGHSMGTILAAHFNVKYPKIAQEMILISAPIYSKKDLEDPRLEEGMKAFTAAVARYQKKFVESKQFLASMENVVKNPKNYETFASISIPTTIFYGAEDKYILPTNIRAVAKENSRIKVVKTEGKHHVSRDKYYKFDDLLLASLKKIK